MLTTLQGIRIRGMCATVPQDVSRFEDEMQHFPFSEQSSRKLARVMGFDEHRIADPATSPCDLASYTMNYLFHTKALKKDSLQALVVVAQMADYHIPGNSKIIHGQLHLHRDVFCTDIYENCTGFISGLYTASCMIAAGTVEEVVLITTDCGACQANIKDRNTYPLCGDAAAVTIVSKSDNPQDVLHFAFHNEGNKHEALYIPAGGRRMPYSEETAKVQQDEMGNYRSLENMHMDGTAVFQFVMEDVPPMIEEICKYASWDKEKIDYYLTHQPNRFMLQKLADLMQIPREKMFNNIVEKFGNTSPVTIPVNITHNLGASLLTEQFDVCYAAFGAGLSLSAALGTIGQLDFCELIEHPCKGIIEYTP